MKNTSSSFIHHWHLLYTLHRLHYWLMYATRPMLMIFYLLHHLRYFRLQRLCYLQHSTLTRWSLITWAEWAIFLSLPIYGSRWPIPLFRWWYRNTEVSLKVFNQASIRQKHCWRHISRLKKLVSACCGRACHASHDTAFTRCMSDLVTCPC